MVVLRRIASIALLLLVVGGLGALVGEMLTPAEFSAGPHRAELRLTPVPTEVIDLGPIGYITKPVDFFGLGFEVSVKEIPTRAGDSTESLSLEQYARLYSDIGAIRANAIHALIEHGVWCAVWADIGAIAVYLGLRALLGAPRRAELRTMFRAKRRLVGVAVLATVVGVVGVDGVRVASSQRPRSNVDRSFDGSPLEGATVEGELLQLVVNQYGPRVSRFIDRTNAFYASVTDNLREAARHTALLQPTSHSETVLFTSAFHCNIGMARPTGELARLWKPSLVVSAGDDALGASGLDASCVDSIGYHLRGRNVVVAPGDHDSDDAEVAMRRRDFAVLDARPVEASGLRILGDDDPRVAVLSGGLTPRRNETVTQMGHRLANLACADKDGIDVLVANEPGAVLETARRGCAKLVLAGSEQNEVFRVPSPVGAPVPAYLAGSAGGAAPNTLTVGTLQAPAHEAIIEIDKATGQPMRYQQVEFGVHGSVVIASITTFAGSPLQSRPR